jgi:hypothetical protein
MLPRTILLWQQLEVEHNQQKDLWWKIYIDTGQSGRCERKSLPGEGDVETQVQ